MKKLFLLLFICCSIGALGQIPTTVNVAVKYCDLMGYELKFDEDTKQTLCVLPNGELVSPYEFFKGRVGQKYSYCNRNGYNIRTKRVERNGAYYAIPICDKKKKKSKSMMELMFQNKKYKDLFRNISAESILLDTVFISTSTRSPVCLGPDQGYDENFDWRYQDGDNFVLDPQDQDTIGICYAMASSSVAESVLAIAEDTPVGEGMLDLSASFIAFFGQFRGFGVPYLWYYIRGDSGALYPYDEPIKRLCYNGIVLEEDFPWVFPITSSSDTTFSEMGCDRYRFTSWNSVGSSKTQIKDALKNGPVYAALKYDSITHSYDGGIIKDRSSGTNHAATIIGWGYDEVKECEYWIVKNSYGTSWGGELDPGYMYVATSNCLGIQDYVYQVTYEPIEITDDSDLAYEDQEILNVPVGYQFIHYRPDPYTLFNGYSSSDEWTSGSTTDLSPKSTVKGEATLIFRVDYDKTHAWPDPMDLDTIVYYERPIWAGKPVEPEVSGSSTIVCSATEWYFATALSENNLYTAESFSWSVSEGLEILNTFSTPPRIRVRATEYGYETITCIATNDIGSDTTDFIVNCLPCPFMSFSVFPNPVSDQLTVKIEGSGNIEPDFQIDLIDSSNRKWKSKTTKSKSTVFSVNDVPEGTYILRVTAKYKGEKIKEESKTIMIIK
ncbi:MAG: T9SS type A sorting domain-containing protein [Bacteroidales bacterium]|nr:T9SS type A sorting domain-containing protein [Bacteroidales bacterium]